MSPLFAMSWTIAGERRTGAFTHKTGEGLLINDGTPLQGGTTYWSKDPDTFPKVRIKRYIRSEATSICLSIDWCRFCLMASNLSAPRVRTGPILSATRKTTRPVRVCPFTGTDSAIPGLTRFLAHREWNVHWGGYLLVLDSRTPAPTYSNDLLGPHVSWIDDASENSLVLDPGFAQCIFPKPNRLVLIAPDAQHLLSRVDVNAGQHPRISVAGFFRKEST